MALSRHMDHHGEYRRWCSDLLCDAHLDGHSDDHHFPNSGLDSLIQHCDNILQRIHAHSVFKLDQNDDSLIHHQQYHDV